MESLTFNTKKEFEEFKLKNKGKKIFHVEYNKAPRVVAVVIDGVGMGVDK